MLNLQIHLRECFLHVLHVLDCHLYQLTPMPDDGSYGAYFGFGPKGCAQQSHRVQILQPLAFMPVSPSSRNVFHVTRIRQARLYSVRFQNVVRRNPINAGCFHRDRRDPTGLQPSGHRVQIFGERLENSYWTPVSIRRHGYKNLSCPNINAPGIGLQTRPVCQAHPLLLFPPAELSVATRRASLSLLFVVGHL